MDVRREEMIVVYPTGGEDRVSESYFANLDGQPTSGGMVAHPSRRLIHVPYAFTD
jgi:hypothetical protein